MIHCPRVEAESDAILDDTQAFARHDLSYVMDTYLPEKPEHPEKFLP